MVVLIPEMEVEGHRLVDRKASFPSEECQPMKTEGPTQLDQQHFVITFLIT